MEKEELIEIINSTINTNGNGTITGESLNLALNAIVETMGTGSGGGAIWEKVSGTMQLDPDITVETTNEDKAANIELLNRCKQYLMNGQPVMCYIFLNQEMDGETFLMNLSGAPVFQTGMLVFYCVLDGLISFVITEDGSVEVVI